MGSSTNTCQQWETYENVHLNEGEQYIWKFWKADRNLREDKLCRTVRACPSIRCTCSISNKTNNNMFIWFIFNLQRKIKSIKDWHVWDDLARVIHSSTRKI